MKREPDFFDGKGPVLVYIAKRLRDALRLESIFTGAGVDYLVEADRYRGGFLFPAERVGAFFYVLEEHQEAVRSLMRDHGYRPFEPAG